MGRWAGAAVGALVLSCPAACSDDAPPDGVATTLAPRPDEIVSVQSWLDARGVDGLRRADQDVDQVVDDGGTVIALTPDGDDPSSDRAVVVALAAQPVSGAPEAREPGMQEPGEAANAGAVLLEETFGAG